MEKMRANGDREKNASPHTKVLCMYGPANSLDSAIMLHQFGVMLFCCCHVGLVFARSAWNKHKGQAGVGLFYLAKLEVCPRSPVVNMAQSHRRCIQTFLLQLIKLVLSCLSSHSCKPNSARRSISKTF